MSATGEQIDWVLRRYLGIARAKAKAEREHNDWTARAATFLYHYAAEVAQGQPFLLEDAREIAHLPRYGVPEPTNSKAWGAAVLFAARRGWIVKGGWAPTRCSNGNPRCLWRAT